MNAKAFDLEPLLEAVSGDLELVGQILGLFMSSAQENLDAIHDGIKKADSNMVKMKAHHLKGSLLELEAAALVALAQQLESMGAEQHLAGADEVWQQLDAGVRDLIKSLSETEYCRSA